MEIYLGENRLKIYMDPTLIKKDRQSVGIMFERYYRLYPESVKVMHIYLV